MRQLVLIIALAVTAFGQKFIPHVLPDEAAGHLLSKVEPIYPPLAQTARIQGNVLLEIRIDPDGKPVVQRLITGHPMLVDAAIQAVNLSKYRPFVLNGKPSAVITDVMVTFGDASTHDAEDQAELAFQYKFWTTEQSAEEAFASGDSAASSRLMSQAESILQSTGDHYRHPLERWKLWNTKGEFQAAQKNNAAAEQSFKNAIAAYERVNRNSPAIGATLGNLGELYASQDQYDLARSALKRSVAIFESNFKQTRSHSPAARQAYGQAVASHAWTLSQLAVRNSDAREAEKQCRTVLKFQDSIDATSRNNFVAACQKIIAAGGR